MATTVTLDSGLVDAVLAATAESTKASAVRKALEEYPRLRRLREFASILGTLDMQFTNDEIEAMEEE